MPMPKTRHRRRIASWITASTLLLTAIACGSDGGEEVTAGPEGDEGEEVTAGLAGDANEAVAIPLTERIGWQQETPEGSASSEPGMQQLLDRADLAHIPADVSVSLYQVHDQLVLAFTPFETSGAACPFVGVFDPPGLRVFGNADLSGAEIDCESLMGTLNPAPDSPLTASDLRHCGDRLVLTTNYPLAAFTGAGRVLVGLVAEVPVPGAPDSTMVAGLGFARDGLVAEELTTSTYTALGCQDLFDPPTIPPSPAGDDELRAAIVAMFFTTTPVTFPGVESTWRPVVTEPEAKCIADGLIERLGTKRLRELSFGLGQWHLLGFRLSVKIDRPDAERMVDAFEACADTWELLLIMSATEGTDRMSADSASCTADRLDDAAARTAFIAELDGVNDTVHDFTPDLSHLDPLLEALDACLSPAELDQLDWN